MKAPTNRAAYMDELSAILADALLGDVSRSYLARRNVSKLAGRECYIDYTEADAPQLIDFQHYGSSKKIRIECGKGCDGLMIYVDGEHRVTLQFDLYKNKITYAAAVAVWVDRYACE
jgi:hypothetical protein